MSAYFLCQLTSAGRMLKKKKTNLKQNFFKELDATLLQKMKKEMKFTKKAEA